MGHHRSQLSLNGEWGATVPQNALQVQLLTLALQASKITRPRLPSPARVRVRHTMAKTVVYYQPITNWLFNSTATYRFRGATRARAERLLRQSLEAALLCRRREDGVLPPNTEERQ